MCPVRCEVPSRAVDQKVGTVLIPTGQEMKPAHATFACWVPSPQPVEQSLTPPSPSLIAHIQSAGSPVEAASRTSSEPRPTPPRWASRHHLLPATAQWAPHWPPCGHPSSPTIYLQLVSQRYLAKTQTNPDSFFPQNAPTASSR